jgi:hypothetical protein
VNVAPDTVSIWAFCAAIVSWSSCGTAYPLIRSVCPSPLGCCSVCALTIFPPRTVTSTCTGPYCVFTTPPATTADFGAEVVGVALGRGVAERVGGVEGVGVLAGVDGVGVVRVGVVRVGGTDRRRPSRLVWRPERVDLCAGVSELTTAAWPVVVVLGCMLARNATATTAVVATVISNLIPRLTQPLLSTRCSP